MKTKIITLFLAFFLSMLSMQAQDHFCHTDEHTTYQRSQDSTEHDKRLRSFRHTINEWRYQNTDFNFEHHPFLDTNQSLQSGSGCANALHIIPVLVHIVHTPGQAVGVGSNITDAQVDNALKVLNDAFSNSNGLGVNTGIQFCLAKRNLGGDPVSGIFRTGSTLADHKRNVETTALLSTPNFEPATNYLNIYVVNDIKDSFGSPTDIQGFATYPWSIGLKGIVVNHDWFGNYTDIGAPLHPQSKGLVLVHEMGYYLGVMHPFDGGCRGLNATDCAMDGDMCCDVPAVAYADDSCIYQNTCTETYNGDPADQVENYMDYSNPICKTKFTPDQHTLMLGTIEKYYGGLVRVENINSKALSCCVQSPLFDGSRGGCIGQNIRFQGFEYTPALTHIWKLWWGDTLIHTFVSSADTFEYTADSIGNYSIQLELVTSNGDTLVHFHPNYTQVFDCSDTLKHPWGNWYFGDKVEWKFGTNGTGPRWDVNPQINPLPTQINAAEGTISQSDDKGNLLFYGGTDEGANTAQFNTEFRIFGPDYAEMDGSPIEGYGTFQNQAITIPRPGDTNQWYIAHMDITGRPLYSIVDMDTITPFPNLRQGVITQKNIKLDASPIAPQFVSLAESVTAIQSCDTSRWWVLYTGRFTGYIYVYEANKDSIFFHDTLKMPWAESIEQFSMEFSPDGSILSVRNYIFDFDRSDASITTRYVDTSRFMWFNNLASTWGNSFSNNSKVLYKYEDVYPFSPSFGVWETPDGPAGLYQYDMESSAPDLGRKLIIQDSPIEQLQMGPDGKIYMSNSGLNYSSVIENPDNLIIQGIENIGFVQYGPRTGVGSEGGSFIAGLPNMVDARGPDMIPLDFYYTIRGCDTVAFKSNQCCAESVTWDFGDGTGLFSGKKVEHAYASNDSFLVRMIANNDTASRWVIFPDVDVTGGILGDSIICDTGAIVSLLAPLNLNHTYSWSGNNISSPYTDHNNFQFIAGHNASAYLSIFDNKTGCSIFDTVNFTVAPKIVQNTISTDTLYCMGDTIKGTGSTPSGGLGNFKYIWRYSLDNNIWVSTPDTTQDMLIGFQTVADTYYISRIVISENCTHKSNVIVAVQGVKSNRIKFAETPCVHHNMKITNDALELNATSFIYGYEFRLDATSNWTVLNAYPNSNAAKLNMFDTTVSDGTLRGYDSFYIRRYIQVDGCNNYSNTLLFKKKFILTQQPNDVSVCNQFSGGSQDFKQLYKVHNPSNYSYIINYNSQQGGGTGAGGLNSIVQGDSIMCGKFQASSPGRDTVPFQWIISVAGCGTTYSENFNFYVNTMADSFEYLNHPKDQLVSPTDSSTIWASVNYPHINPWKWEKADTYSAKFDTAFTLKNNFVTAYSDYDTTGVNTVKVYANAIGVKSAHYRAIANNGCYFTPSNWAMVSNRSYDIYMKDFPADTGAEPNITEQFTHSYDVWISDDPNYPQPQKWEEQDGLKVDKTNYIKVMVRNRSGVQSDAANLFLYWTNASTSEVWPKHWTKNNNNRRWNSDSAKYYYEGGQINNNPISIPSIAAHDSTTIFFTWPQVSNYADTIPKNEWFQYFRPNGKRDYDLAKWICILARIETCDDCASQDTSKGMSFSERQNENIAYNVIYNNNIVSSNMKRVYIQPPTSDPLVYVDRSRNHTRVRGMKDTVYPVQWEFNSRANTYNNVGEVYIHTDADFWTLWEGAGFPGTGFVQIDSGLIKMTNPNSVRIGPIDIPQGFEASVGFSYHMKENANTTGADTSYGFEFVQLDMTDTLNPIKEGSVAMGLVGPQSYAGGGGYQGGSGELVVQDDKKDESIDGINPNTLKLETAVVTKKESITIPSNPNIRKTDALSNKVTIYPNPFTEYLKVQVQSGTEKQVSIWITDLNGKMIAVAVQNQNIVSGSTVFSIDTRSLASGDYIVHVDGVLENRVKKKVILIK